MFRYGGPQLSAVRSGDLKIHMGQWKGAPATAAPAPPENCIAARGLP